MNLRRNFYVYIYYRLDGRPCYVGKGTGSRWKSHARKSSAGTHLNNIIKKAFQAGCELPVEFIQGLTEPEAFDLERELIAGIGRECDGGPLVNLSEGGKGGSSGVIHGEDFRRKRRAIMIQFYEEHPEAREKLSLRAKGNNYNKQAPRTPEWCERIRVSLLGNKRSLGRRQDDESKAKISAALKGRPQSPEHVEARIAPLRGKTRDPEIGRKISQARKGISFTEEHKINIGNAVRGYKHTIKECENRRIRMLGNKNFEGISHTEESKFLMTLKKNQRDRENILAAMAGWPGVEGTP